MNTPRTEPQWDLSHLRLFELIVAEGSLTRVAALLGTPQPAVSRKLSRFEKECGGELFMRTGRGLRLSDLGQQILPRAQTVQREAEHLSHDIVARSAVPFGEVRLGVLPSLSGVLVVPLFTALRESFPGIVLKLSEGSAGHVEQWLASGMVNVGVTLRYGDRKTTDPEALKSVDAYLVGAPDRLLTRKPEVPFKALNETPLVMPGAPSSTRLLIEQLGRRHGVTLNVVAESDSTHVQMGLAARGGVYVILSVQALATASKPLRSSLIVNPKISRYLALGLTPARPASRARLRRWSRSCWPRKTEGFPAAGETRARHASFDRQSRADLL